MTAPNSTYSFITRQFCYDRIRQLLLITALFFITGCASSPQSHKYDNAKVSKLLRVYDGDTFVANIQDYPDLIGKEIRIRLKDYNAPEIKNASNAEIKLGLEAKSHLSKLLTSAKTIELRNIKRGKYFRIVANVYINGKLLKPLLKDYSEVVK